MGERTDPFIQQTGDCGMEFAEGRMLRCQQDTAAHAVQPEGSGLPLHAQGLGLGNGACFLGVPVRVVLRFGRDIWNRALAGGCGWSCFV